MSISRQMDKKAVIHIHNGVLLSHYKEYIWISPNEVDETGADIQSEASQKEKHKYSISWVQFSHSVMFICDPMIVACQASLSITNSQSSLKLTSIESVMPSSHVILCCLLLLLPQSFQHHSLFQRVNSSHEVAKVQEFQLQHHSFQRYPRADSFRMDWFDLLAVLGNLESLLQHHSSKASILQC